MKVKLIYSLTTIKKTLCCEFEVFEDLPSERYYGFTSGETFEEVRVEVLRRARDLLLNRKDPSLEIPSSEEIEL